MAIYTSLQSGQQASYGTSGQAVRDFQHQLNITNQGKTGYVPIAEDAKYGPLTLAASKFGQGSTTPTTIGNSNKITQVSQNMTDLNNLANKGITTDNTGTPKYADGSFVPEQSATADTSSEDQQYNDIFNSLKSSLDASTKSQIDNIQQKFEQRKSEQADINARAAKGTQNALLMGGVTGQGSSAQYAPISSGGIMQAQESYGLKQIAALDSDENDAIAQAKAAQDTQNFKLMDEKLQDIRDIRKQKQDAAIKLNEQIAERNRVGKIDNAITGLYTSGTTDPAKILSELGKMGISASSEDVASAVKNITPNTDTIKLADGTTLLIDKATGKTIKNFGGGTGGSSSSGTPGSVVRTVSVNGTATPVDGYTLQAGDDPYLIAHQYGTDMTELQALNPQVTDWHNLPVGFVLNVPNTDNGWLKGKTPAQVQAFNSLPEEDRNSVKQLVNGDVLLTDIVKSRGKDGQAQITKLINEASKIDPNFSVNANKQRYTYKTEFNNPNSKSQAQITAINTGLGHLAEFKIAADALGNQKFTNANDVKNYLSKHSGDPSVTNFNTVTTALASELATIYKGGTAPTDSEIKDWQNNIYANFSNQQSTGVANITSGLISNKLASLGQAYKDVMGNYPDNPLISPATVSTLQGAGIDVTPITTKLKAQGYSVPNSSPEDAKQVVLGIAKKDPNKLSLISQMLADGNSYQDVYNYFNR